MNTRLVRSGAILASVVLAAACGGAQPSGAPTTPGTSAPAPAGSPAVVDQALLADLLAAGVAEDDATFLAATTFEVTAPDAHATHVAERLASGDIFEFSVSVAPTDQSPGVVTSTSISTADRSEGRLTYVIDGGGLPTDVRQALTAAAGPRLLAAGGGPLTADVSFFGVTIEWAIKKVQSTVRDTAIKSILEKVSPNQVGPLTALLKAAFTVEKLDQLDQKLRDLLTKLKELEDCAKDPTNPLTIKQYQEDRGAKDRLLQQIAEARDEMVNNTIVMQLGVLNGVLAGLGPKWLGYVIGPGTAWSQATLQQLNEERLGEITRAVPKCDCPFDTSGGGSSGGGSTGGGTSGGSSGGSSGGGASSQSCSVPLTWTGRADYSIQANGQTVFTAHITGIVWKLNPALGGGTISAYDLEAASIAWTYHASRQDGQCTTTMDGQGTESGVPNEAVTGGGEAGGPFHDAERASLVVHWTDEPMNRPTPFYVGLTHARLHHPIQWVDSCHDPDGEFDPDVLDMFMGNWFQTPVDPFPVIKDATMSGTWTETVSPYRSATWTWEFIAGK